MERPENLRTFDALVEIIAKLRGPDGCPWDKEQTHESLREHLLEESYEVLDAVDGGNRDELCEELGDLALQIVLHAQIAKDDGEFEIADVMEKINSKLIYRHPHVFGETEVADSAEVAKNWQALKKDEKPEGESMLSGVPKSMPALGFSQTVQRKVAQAGFDWEDLDGVVDKLAEEIAEFKEAEGEHKAEEFGDVLFTLVNYARRLGIDSEAALREANTKFYKRFTCMEDLCREQGIDFNDLSFDEQNLLWEEAKEKTADR